MKAIIFDLDNTLEEWLPFEDETEKRISLELSKKYGFDPLVFQKIFDNVKIGYLQKDAIPQDFARETWFVETFAHFGIENAPIEDIVSEYWDLLIEKVRLFPGTHELLTSLKKHYKLAILTDSDGHPFWKQRRILHLGIAEYFDAIITSDDTGANKPHPRCFLAVCDALHVRPQECVMVGDSLIRDLSMAKELGMITIWQREGIVDQDIVIPEFVDHIVDSIKEVEAIVTQKTAKIRH